MASLVFAMFSALMTTVTYVQCVQTPKLDSDARNARALYREYGAERGPIIVDDESVAVSVAVDNPHKYRREYRVGSSYVYITSYFSTTHNSMTGIERTENGVFGGSDSALTTQRVQKMIPGSHRKGGAVFLTPDPVAQKTATEALGNQRGTVVAINPKTGAILVQVSTPSYDPNQLATHDSEAARAAYSQLSTDKTHPLVSRVLGGDQYASSSALKMPTATTMLENSDFMPDSIVDAPDTWVPSGTTHKINNPGKLSCGDESGCISLRQVLIQSYNTPFAMGGVNVGGEEMLVQTKGFGFGTTFETPQIVDSSRFPEPSNRSALTVDSIGQ